MQMESHVTRNGVIADIASDDCSPAEFDTRRDRPVKLVIVAAWSVTVIPNFALKLLGLNQQALLNELLAVPPLISLLRNLFAVVLVAACVYAATRPWRGSGLRDATGLAVFVVPFFLFVSLEFLRGSSIPIASATYFLLVFGIWRCSPSNHVLGTLGILGGVAAGVSIALGLLVPRLGLFVKYAGTLAVSEKGLFSDNSLSGAFNSPNNLGQFLAISICCLLFARNLRVQFPCYLLSVVAIVWSNSRSSIAVAAIATGAWFIYRRKLPNRVIHRVLPAAVVGSMAFAIALPFVASSATSSFSGRGLIWAISISSWEHSPVFGLGVDWYTDEALNSIGFGRSAASYVFHAHNQFLHVLVTGGIACFAAFMILMAIVIRRASVGNSADWRSSVVVIAFCISGSLELNLGFLDRQQLLITALIPLAVVTFSRRDQHRNLKNRHHGS